MAKAIGVVVLVLLMGGCVPFGVAGSQPQLIGSGTYSSVGSYGSGDGSREDVRAYMLKNLEQYCPNGFDLTAEEDVTRKCPGDFLCRKEIHLVAECN